MFNNSFQISNQNVNINFNNTDNNLPVEITKEQFDLLRYEFSDDYIRKRYNDMEEIFNRIFRNYIKFLKFLKNKEESYLKRIIEETLLAQKTFLNIRSLIEKSLIIRKKSKVLENNINIKTEGLTERERSEIFDELNTRKELMKRFRRNIIELETISKNIQETIETISLSNSMLTNYKA